MTEDGFDPHKGNDGLVLQIVWEEVPQRALLAELGLTQRAALVRYASERGLL
jgi:hypothetical protein